jgi:hypothetical protein
MGEVVWPHLPEAKRQGIYRHWPNVEAWLHNMAWVVVMLLRQCDDQLKIGFPLIEFHIIPLVTN